MSRADTRVYLTLHPDVAITSNRVIEAPYGHVSIGVDLSIFGSADDLTRLSVALLKAAAGDPPEYDREADDA